MTIETIETELDLTKELKSTDDKVRYYDDDDNFLYIDIAFNKFEKYTFKIIMKIETTSSDTNRYIVGALDEDSDKITYEFVLDCVNMGKYTRNVIKHNSSSVFIWDEVLVNEIPTINLIYLAINDEAVKVDEIHIKKPITIRYNKFI